MMPERTSEVSRSQFFGRVRFQLSISAMTSSRVDTLSSTLCRRICNYSRCQTRSTHKSAEVDGLETRASFRDSTAVHFAAGGSRNFVHNVPALRQLVLSQVKCCPVVETPQCRFIRGAQY